MHSRAELAEVMPLRARLDAVDAARLDDRPSPPPELLDRILGEIRLETADRGRSTNVPLHGRRVERRARVMIGVAAAVFALSGFAVAWVVKPDPPGPPLEPVAVVANDPSIADVTASLVPHRTEDGPFAHPTGQAVIRRQSR